MSFAAPLVQLCWPAATSVFQAWPSAQASCIIHVTLHTTPLSCVLTLRPAWLRNLVSRIARYRSRMHSRCSMQGCGFSYTGHTVQEVMRQLQGGIVQHDKTSMHRDYIYIASAQIAPCDAANALCALPSHVTGPAGKILGFLGRPSKGLSEGA